MKYLIVSDSHNALDVVERLKKIAESVDAIIHLGDNCHDIYGMLSDSGQQHFMVRGNCDADDHSSIDQDWVDSGHTIFITHGHAYDIKSGLLPLSYRAQEIGAHVVLYGHSHMPYTEQIEGVWFHNPGSLSLPKGGTKAGYSIMNISDAGVDIVRYSL